MPKEFPPADPLKWLNDPGERNRKSKKDEERIAKELDGRRQRRSGGASWSKYDQGGPNGPTKLTDGRDITTASFHLEHKRTEGKSISVKREWLEKIRDSAARACKEPGIVLTFEKQSAIGTTEDWVLIPLDLAKKLMSAVKCSFEDDGD